jgi:hypothetical protein
MRRFGSNARALLQRRKRRPLHCPGLERRTLDRWGRIRTGPPGTNPGGVKSATNPTGAKTLEERGTGTGPPGTNPGGVGTSPNQRGMGGERATQNGGNAPKMPNTGTQPLQPMPHRDSRLAMVFGGEQRLVLARRALVLEL